MTADQIGGILRAVIPGIVALASHYGFGSAAQDTLILTAIATAIVAGWSAWTNSPAVMAKSVSANAAKGS